MCFAWRFLMGFFHMMCFVQFASRFNCQPRHYDGRYIDMIIRDTCCHVLRWVYCIVYTLKWYETVWNNTLQCTCIVSEISSICDEFLAYCNHSTLCALCLTCFNMSLICLHSSERSRISLDPTISTCCFHRVNLGPELKGARPGRKYTKIQVNYYTQQESTTADLTGCCQRSIHLHKAFVSWTLNDMLPQCETFQCGSPGDMRLSPIARLLFNQLDDPVLEYQALTSLKLSLPLSHIVRGTSRSKRARRSSPIGWRLGECEATDSLAVSKVRETWDSMEWQGEGRQVPGCKMKCQSSPEVCSHHSNDTGEWVWRYRHRLDELQLCVVEFESRARLAYL